MYVLTENKLLKTGKDGEIIQKTAKDYYYYTQEIDAMEEKAAQFAIDVLLPIFEKHYADDSRIHAAIEAVKEYKKKTPKFIPVVSEPIKLHAKPECAFDCGDFGMPDTKKCDCCKYQPPF